MLSANAWHFTSYNERSYTCLKTRPGCVLCLRGFCTSFSLFKFSVAHDTPDELLCLCTFHNLFHNLSASPTQAHTLTHYSSLSFADTHFCIFYLNITLFYLCQMRRNNQKIMFTSLNSSSLCIPDTHSFVLFTEGCKVFFLMLI